MTAGALRTSLDARWQKAGAGSRLFRKYAVLFVGLVGGALLVNGAMETYFSYQENKEILLRLQKEKAIAGANIIQRFIHEIENQMGWTMHGAFLAGPMGLAQRRIDFLRLLRQAPAITEIRFLDGKGSEKLLISRLRMDVLGSGADFSTDPKFTRARAGKRYFSPVYFRQGSEPYMTMSLADPKPSKGVTVAEVNLKLIWDEIFRIRAGKAGHAYIVDSSGFLISHPDIGLVLRRTSFASLTQVRAALAAAKGSGADLKSVEIARNIEGKEVLTAHTRIASLNWTVFVESPLGEAFAPIYDSLFRTVILMLLGLVLAVSAGLFFARRIAKPVQAIREGAERIGAGDLASRIDIHTGDELETVAGQFNDMAGKLEESYANLEQKVVERTAELRTAMGQIEAQSAELEGWNKELESRVADQVEELERMGRLKRFLSPQVAELVIAQGADGLLESHRREVTIVFCDLRGFTPFAEIAKPEDVMGVLAAYHQALGTRVHEYEGTVERFAGDGVMVLFNDPLPCPDHAARAVAMAADIRDDVASLAAGWREQGFHLGFGVGIAQGTATLGRIGFEGRFDYGAAGSVVNLASRLCDSAKDGQILISEPVHAATKEIVPAVALGPMPLKGFQHDTEVYNVS